MRNIKKYLKYPSLKYSSFSKAQLLAFIAVFAIIGGYILLQSHAAGTAANVFVSSNGSDTGINCKRFSTPVTDPDPGGTSLCATFNKAIQVAQRGDIVEIENGIYGSQHLTSVPGGSSGVVKFVPASGASVTVGNGGSNSCAGASTTFYTICVEGGSYIEFDNLTIPSANAIRVINTNPGTTGSTDVIFRNVTAGTWRLEGQVANISFIGGSYGNVVDSQPQIKKYNGNGDPDSSRPYNTLIDGVTFHDFRRSGGSVHTECLQLIASNKTLIQNSTFYNCDGTGDLGITDGPHDDLTIQNNFIGGGGDTGFGAQITMSTRNLVFQYNSSSQAIFFSDTATGFGPYTFRGNYIPSNLSFCNNQATYSHNVINGGSTCSSAPGGSTNVSVSSLDFVDSANHNLHLNAGANAIGQGDPASYPAKDIDGDNRPQGNDTDAGADEFVPTANVWVSTTGNDSTCARGDQIKPCLTLDKAYHMALPGDVVEVACGNYPAQTISYDATKAGNTSYITFQPASASGICWNQINKINIGTDSVTPPNEPSYIYLKNFSYGGGITVHQQNDIGPTVALVTNINLADHITIDGQNGGYFVATGTTNLLVENGDFGNCRSNKITVGGAGDYVECDAGFKPSLSGQRPSGTVRSSKFHDISLTSGNPECGAGGVCHVEGMEFSSANGVTLDRDLFYNNAVAAMRIQNRNGQPAGEMTNITIQNSQFDIGNSVGAELAPVQVDSEISGFVFRFNSISLRQASNGGYAGYLQCSGGSMDTNSTGSNCGTDSSHAKIYGNIMAKSTCSGDSDYSYNLMVPFSNNPPYNSSCGSGDQIISPASVAYTNDPLPNGGNLPNNGIPNFDITGAGWVGDNYIPINVTGGYPSADYHGLNRPLDTGFLDVGAVERTVFSSNPIPGDLNSDTHVNITDLSILLSHYGQSATASQGDINSDDTCNIVDLSILLSHYGT